jgi:hypothetical protein
MERNGTVWDGTRMEAEEYSAYWDCTGRYGKRRRDLQNRRLQVRFLSYLHENPEFIRAAITWPQPKLCALTPFDTTKSNTADICVRPSW